MSFDLVAQAYPQLLLATVFLLLSGVHFYWAMGGKWWLSNALPMNEQGDHVLKPSKVPTTIVGVGLLGFGSFYIALFLGTSVSVITSVVGWIIPSVFFLRAIGDFKYVGFFKRVKSTPFSKYDSRFYVPLCLTLAVVGAAVAFQL